MRACREFRARLADALGAPSSSAREGVAGLTSLSWHEHLLGCADCRTLLEAEEALEALLATLPEPVLPPALAQRVLARLARARGERALDELLERGAELAVPAGLAGGVLAALRPQRDEAALDRLLDRLAPPEPPAGLARRVLRGLEPQRARRAPAGRRRPAPWALGVAAALLLAFSWAAWMARGKRDPQPAHFEEPSEALLASLELLESWELLAADDLDLALADLDEVGLLILELEAEDS